MNNLTKDSLKNISVLLNDTSEYKLNLTTGCDKDIIFEIKYILENIPLDLVNIIIEYFLDNTDFNLKKKLVDGKNLFFDSSINITLIKKKT